MGSKKPNSSTTETKPWGPAQEHLENILQNAGNLFDSQGGINAEWLDKEVADLTPEMQQTIKDMVNTDDFKKMASNINQATQQGLSGIGQASGTLGGLTQQGITADDINKMAGELYDSDLVKSQKENLGKELQQGLAKTTQGINQAASGSGNMGSSRAGVAEGVAIGETADAYATGAAGIENAARTSAQQQAMGTLMGNQSTALGAAGQLGQLGLGSGNLQIGAQNSLLGAQGNALQGALIGQNHNQNILNNKWFNQQGQQNMGWDMLNKYASLAGSIGSMGGTTTQTGPGADRFGQMLGAGTALGGAWMMSDERLKDNVELVQEGVAALGLPAVYKWDWNKKAHDLFIEHEYKDVPAAFGTLAQHLESIGLEAYVVEVDTDVEGLDGLVKFVNYAALNEHCNTVMGKMKEKHDRVKAIAEQMKEEMGE